MLSLFYSLLCAEVHTSLSGLCLFSFFPVCPFPTFSRCHFCLAFTSFLVVGFLAWPLVGALPLAALAALVSLFTAGAIFSLECNGRLRRAGCALADTLEPIAASSYCRSCTYSLLSLLVVATATAMLTLTNRVGMAAAPPSSTAAALPAILVATCALLLFGVCTLASARTCMAAARYAEIDAQRIAAAERAAAAAAAAGAARPPAPPNPFSPPPPPPDNPFGSLRVQHVAPTEFFSRGAEKDAAPLSPNPFASGEGGFTMV
jgi:hypothetical protein